ncbi:cytochrome P450 [Citreimonas salinaria]|uniref:Fatty-acid peroxygenase n=1 Tax=Citreimonas salinaria TaxID=321339 RepID=A0A1H3KVD9_9RHOB|nr:cytochrome P450 [Citreimonas salinaria]SDY56143.1 fatty-acid peroxygenase [Citreimonas salinaria]
MPERSSEIPTLPGFDSTTAFLREGYRFVSRRCQALGSDGFRTRIMLRPVTCLRGAEAAREFYRPGRMTRRGAMPKQVLKLLQDKGSVQMLDDAPHRVRKAMFMDLMTPGNLDRARQIFDEEWRAAVRGWTNREIALSKGVRDVMTRTAMRWCGLDPAAHDSAARSAELSAMYASAGKLGPAYLRARLLRARSERWARRVIGQVRKAEMPDDSAVARIAFHVDADGAHLTEAAAAVELLNLLRPIVAVGRYVVFVAHALHVHRDSIPADRNDDAMNAAIAHEVRRLYPFFPVIGGRVREPFEWRGARFDRGDWLLLDLYGTNRDPASWPMSETFRPERHEGLDEQPDALIPQGGGDYLKNHRCPGEWLTVALMTEAVGQLRDMQWHVPQQNLDLPANEFPPIPGDGMRIVVNPGAPAAAAPIC